MRKKGRKGRTPVKRSLPPLAEVCPGFKGFQRGSSRLDQIAEMLAGVIERCRQAKPQPFYAMRETAEFFGVSLRTMAKVYRRLNREGALTLVRSSQSLVPARKRRPRVVVRGVVCMPIWLPGFLQFLDWRRWFSLLEEELARYHFALEPIFYKLDEDGNSFADRVLKFNPDYLLWNWPTWVDRLTMQLIADAGVNLISVQSPRDLSFPGRAYCMSNERGMSQGLAEWAAEGEIKEVVVPRHLSSNLSFQPLLEAGPLPCRIEPFVMENKSTADFLSYLQGLARDRHTGIFFADDLLYSHLCTIAPEGMIECMRGHRVLVTRQVTIPSGGSTPPPGITVDALVYPWKKLARRIAADLGNPNGISAQDVIEAEWQPQVPLAEVMQTFFFE